MEIKQKFALKSNNANSANRSVSDNGLSCAILCSDVDFYFLWRDERRNVLHISAAQKVKSYMWNNDLLFSPVPSFIAVQLVTFLLRSTTKQLPRFLHAVAISCTWQSSVPPLPFQLHPPLFLSSYSYCLSLDFSRISSLHFLLLYSPPIL